MPSFHFINMQLKDQISTFVKISLAMEFIGHGSFGIIKKVGWLPFYSVFGFSDEFAFQTMPAVGLHDIVLAILVLFRPVPAVFLWMGCWGFFTALLRPMAGQGWLEFFERSYNYGLPWFAFYMATSFGSKSDGLGTLWKPWPLQITKNYSVQTLRLIAFSALFSHSLLMLFFKTEKWQHYYNMSVLGSSGFATVGIIELLMSISILFVRSRGILWSILIFKILLEGAPILGGKIDGWLEFIERGSCFFAIFLLIQFLIVQQREPVSIVGAFGARDVD